MSSTEIAEVIYGNSDYFLSIDIGSWLSKRGKVFADMSEATLMVKNRSDDADLDALMTKVIGSGLTESGDKYLVETLSTDFGAGKLESGKTYRMYFGVKFTGDTSFREIILRVPKITILSDGIRA